MTLNQDVTKNQSRNLAEDVARSIQNPKTNSNLNRNHLKTNKAITNLYTYHVKITVYYSVFYIKTL